MACHLIISLAQTADNRCDKVRTAAVLSVKLRWVTPVVEHIYTNLSSACAGKNTHKCRNIVIIVQAEHKDLTVVGGLLVFTDHKLPFEGEHSGIICLKIASSFFFLNS